MKRIVRFLILISFLFSYSYAVSSKYYQDKFNTTKKLYLGAVMSSDKQKEILYLKKLIQYGEKLKIDTIKYKRELNRLDKSTIVTKPLKTTFKLKPKYTIKDITSNDNTVIIEFNKKIDNSYIKFNEKKEKKLFIDSFDIKGSYKDAKAKKITLRNIDKTVIYQANKNTLRILLKNKTNPKTIYIVHQNKIIIKTLKPEKKKTKEVKLIKSSKKGDLFKDKFSVKSVKKIENTVIVEFNHKVNKSHITFFEEKKKGLFIDGFDLKGNYKDAKTKKLKFKGIDKTVIYQKDPKTLRILLKDKTNPKTIYILSNNKVIIKLLDKPKSQIKKQDYISPYDKVIVIDPGHGGKDPGAVNGKYRQEKKIVLNIGKYLKKELQKRGFKVYLTRSRDKYVKLPNRTKYANRKKADMFISLHANAARKSRASKAYGVETYFLSPARSARAKRVAALENKGDIKNMGWSSQNSLLTILNQGKITASNKMAIDIQRNMLYYLRQRYGKKNIKDGGVREGPFWVLVGAQMPSILVEIGYISHPKEGRRINTAVYQKLVAKGIARGVERYFIKN